MRLWQKSVLAVLALTALSVLSGTAAVLYGALALPADPAPRASAAALEPASPRETTPTPAVAVVLAAATATPFQPIPWTPTASPPPPTLTSTPTIMPSSTPTPAAALSESVFIQGIWGYPQTFNLSCESRSAADLARYFGVDFTELEFLYALPVSDNPEYGFVGDVGGYLGQLPPYGYGVYAGPVAEVLRDFGLAAKAHRDMTLEQVLEEVASGRPVMVWAIRDLDISTPVEYVAADGSTTIVARFEHTFIVIGYGESYVTLLDNQWVYSVPVEQFLASWAVLGNMGITVDSPGS